MEIRDMRNIINTLRDLNWFTILALLAVAGAVLAAVFVLLPLTIALAGAGITLAILSTLV